MSFIPGRTVLTSVCMITVSELAELLLASAVVPDLGCTEAISSLWHFFDCSHFQIKKKITEYDYNVIGVIWNLMLEF